MSKLPNLFVAPEEIPPRYYGHDPRIFHARDNPEQEMFVPAAKLRELVEKFGHEAYRHAPKEWLLKELEALLKEPGE